MSRETDNFRNDRGQGDDYRYSEEARSHDLQLIWKCDKCKRERRDYPGVNEGGKRRHRLALHPPSRHRPHQQPARPAAGRPGGDH